MPAAAAGAVPPDAHTGVSQKQTMMSTSQGHDNNPRRCTRMLTGHGYRSTSWHTRLSSCNTVCVNAHTRRLTGGHPPEHNSSGPFDDQYVDHPARSHMQSQAQARAMRAANQHTPHRDGTNRFLRTTPESSPHSSWTPSDNANNAEARTPHCAALARSPWVRPCCPPPAV